MELTTNNGEFVGNVWLFMMSKIQNLNGTHNKYFNIFFGLKVVYDVKDTKFEWNSQHNLLILTPHLSCL